MRAPVEERARAELGAHLRAAPAGGERGGVDHGRRREQQEQVGGRLGAVDALGVDERVGGDGESDGGAEEQVPTDVMRLVRVGAARADEEHAGGYGDHAGDLDAGGALAEHGGAEDEHQHGRGCRARRDRRR